MAVRWRTAPAAKEVFQVSLDEWVYVSGAVIVSTCKKRVRDRKGV